MCLCSAPRHGKLRSCSFSSPAHSALQAAVSSNALSQISLRVVLVAARVGLRAQQLSERLTNQDVIELVAVGLADDVIIEKIHATQGTDFDTSV